MLRRGPGRQGTALWRALCFSLYMCWDHHYSALAQATPWSSTCLGFLAGQSAALDLQLVGSWRWAATWLLTQANKGTPRVWVLPAAAELSALQPLTKASGLAANGRGRRKMPQPLRGAGDSSSSHPVPSGPAAAMAILQGRTCSLLCLLFEPWRSSRPLQCPCPHHSHLL